MKGLAELAAAGLYAAAAGERTDLIERKPLGGTVLIPGDLLADHRVGVRGRILYGHLQLTPEFRHQAGQFSYAFLSSLSRNGLQAVKRAVSELVETGWLQITQKNQLAPVHFVLRNPIDDRSRAEVARAERRLEEAPFLGEALMREYLSLLVDADDFEDNAAPGFLVNPWTDERLQFDRFYPPGVAFEFNGPQHYGPTDRFSGGYAAKQRGRDYMPPVSFGGQTEKAGRSIGSSLSGH